MVIKNQWLRPFLLPKLCYSWNLIPKLELKCVFDYNPKFFYTLLPFLQV